MTPERMADIHARAFGVDRHWSAEEFAALLAQKGVRTFSRAHAFALTRLVVDETELLTLATDPDHQRKGLAHKLTLEWLTQSQARGATRAYLEVASDNGAAQALYAQIGFVESGRRKRYYARTSGAHADAIAMFFDLTQRQASDSNTDAQESG